MEQINKAVGARISSASPSAGHFLGKFRGIVEDVDDPHRFGRVRVRVLGVHPDELPVKALDWAEISSQFGGTLFGNIVHYEKGDRVWVEFERGDRRFPLVTGGWTSAPLGFSDQPPEINAEFLKGRKKWMMIDRVGNLFELSEDVGEQHALIRSGSAEVLVTQRDGSVTLTARNGTVRTDASTEHHESKFYILESGQVIISAQALDDLGGVAGVLTSLANLEMNLHVDGDLATDGVLNVGGYMPTFKGVKTGDPTTNMQARQTKAVNLIPRRLRVGSAVGDTDGGFPRPETEVVTVDGVTVTITAQPAVESPSGLTPKVRIQVTGGDAEIAADGKVKLDAPEIDATAATKATIHAPEVDVEGTTKVKVTAPEIEATATVKATVAAPEVDVNATVLAKVVAPTIQAQATIAVQLIAGGTTFSVTPAGVSIT